MKSNLDNFCTHDLLRAADDRYSVLLKSLGDEREETARLKEALKKYEGRSQAALESALNRAKIAEQRLKQLADLAASLRTTRAE